MTDLSNEQQLAELIEPLEKLVRQVGQQLVLDWHKMRSSDCPDVSQKEDHTPVTEADHTANRMLCDGLQSILPDCPLISEEGPCPEWEERQHMQQCWLIDPLDGTRGFIAGNSHFSINVALIVDHRPLLGVLYHPCAEGFYYAIDGAGAFFRDGKGAASQPLSTRDFDRQQLTAILGEESCRVKTVMARHIEAEGWNLLGINSALKFTYLADGRADFYPRRGPIYEWDIAAGQCILEQAGGAVVDLQGRALRYNYREKLSLPPFVAVADRTAIDDVVKLIKGVADDD